MGNVVHRMLNTVFVAYIHKNGAVIRIEDYSQDLEVDVCIIHKADWDEKDVDRFTIGGEAAMPSLNSNDDIQESEEEKKEGNEIEEVEIIHERKDLIMNGDNSMNKNMKKRPCENHLDGPTAFKKTRNDCL
jgi:hypothetical protein